MRIAHFGTFDVANYGDLLFPLILRQRLGPVADEIVHVSPAGGAPVIEEGSTTIAVEAALADAGGYDGVVLGGGNLVHTASWNADFYDRGGVTGVLAYPRLWAGASLLAARHDVPLVWNAVGVPLAVPADVTHIFSAAVALVDRVALRDRSSARRVVEAAPGTNVHVVPDTGLEVSKLWTAADIDEAYGRAFESRGREVPQRALVVHVNDRYVNDDLETLASRIDRMAREADATPVLIALAPCHGDDRLQRQVAAAMQTTPLTVDRLRSLREVAALIGRSVGYVGSSMHGLVTACSFAVPGLAVLDEARTGLAKASGFLETIGLQGRVVASWEEAERSLAKALDEPTKMRAWAADGGLTLLDAHWAATEAALKSTTERGKRDFVPGLEEALDRGVGPYGGLTAHVARHAHGRAEKAGALEHERNVARQDGLRNRRIAEDASRALADLELKLDAARSELASVSEERDRRRGEAESAGQRIEELGAALAASQARLEVIERAAVEDRQARRDQVAHLEATIERRREQIASVTDEAGRLRADAEGLERQAAAFVAERAAADERRQVVENAGAEEARRREAAERALDEERRRNAELSERLKAVESTQRTLQANLAAATEQRTTEEARRREGEGERDVLRDRVENSRRELEGLRAGSGAERRLRHLLRIAAADAARVRADLERVERSRSWRWGHGFFRALRAVSLRRSAYRSGAVESALGRVADLQQTLARSPEPPAVAATSNDDHGDGDGDGPVSPVGPGSASRLNRSRVAAHRPKVSVISWDMGHNPLGRAHVLADLLRDDFDVEIVGPLFERYGGRLWPPLRESPVAMRTSSGHDFPEHFRAMTQFASGITGDVLFVSKPRLPSYELGMLAKAFRNRPLLLDCDDRELSFFDARDGLTLEEVAERRADESFLVPYGALWTRYCDSIIGLADRVTVSNPALQHLYGGTILPHARDERHFTPDRSKRSSVRRRFELDDDQRVVLFVGTPRAHKGLQQIVRALDEIGNARNILCLVGTITDRRLTKELEPYSRWIRFIPDQPFRDLPQLLGMADLVCVLQDPSSEIAKYQIPAKLTDALAMGVACLVSNVPPLRPFAELGAVRTVGDEPLANAMQMLLDDDSAREALGGRAREVFLDRMSYAATRPPITEVIRSLLDDPPPQPAEFDKLIDFHQKTFGSMSRAAPQPVPTPVPVPKRVIRRSAAFDEYDIVVFWKQNDSGIYGRRQDMLVKFLAQSPRIRRIVHFDEPVSAAALVKRVGSQQAHQARLIQRQTRLRVAGLRHEGKIARHTFIHRDGEAAFSPFRLLPPRADYPAYLASTMARWGVGSRKTVFLVYPRNFDFPELAKLLEPDLVIADVVDDHRAWFPAGHPYRERLATNYREIVTYSDIVLANCESVRDSMQQFGQPVHLLPNAAEPENEAARARMPRELRGLKGPIAGYAGNLSSRIDVALLERLVAERPRLHVLLIGSAHLNRDVLKLDAYPNVHFLGVRPYAEVKRLIDHFDVGLIPHTIDELTRSMNPLKAFVYAAANVPVVSTCVANLPEMGAAIAKARTHDEFIAYVDAAVERGRPTDLPAETRTVLEQESWPRRVERIIELLDETVAN